MATLIMKPRPGNPTPDDDRTPDIISAINSLPPRGGTIHFGAGIYYIKSSLEVSKLNVIFTGEGGHKYSISTCRCADAGPTGPCPDLPSPCTEGTNVPKGGIIGAATELRFMPAGAGLNYAIKATKEGFGMRDISVTTPAHPDPGNNVSAIIATAGYGFFENVLLATRYRPGIYNPKGIGLFLEAGSGYKLRGCKITGFDFGIIANGGNGGLSIFQTNIEANNVGVVIGKVSSVARAGITESIVENNFLGNIHIKKALNVCLDNNYVELSTNPECYHVKVDDDEPQGGGPYTSMHVTVRNNYITGQPGSFRYTGVMKLKTINSMLIEDTLFIQCRGQIFDMAPTAQFIRANHITVLNSAPFVFSNGNLPNPPQVIL